MLLGVASLPTHPFRLGFAGGRIVSLRDGNAASKVDYLEEKAALGTVRLAYRKPGEGWRTGGERGATTDAGGAGSSWRVGDALSAHSWFEPRGSRLVWRFSVRNVSDGPVELGGLGLPLPMRTGRGKDAKPAVLKHSFLSGAGSFAFWSRFDGAGPRLVMVPLRGTSFEYWNRGEDDTFEAFVHSASEGPTIRAHQGSWRLPHTARTLRPGEAAEYGVAFAWAQDDRAVRDLLARNGGLDVQVAPGMTVPSDLTADVALRSSIPVTEVRAEFPRETDVRPMPSRGGYRIYRVRFRRLGENRLAVRQRDGGTTSLEFFACQPVETLIRKRAAFIARSQVRDASKWYDGLLREWAMDRRIPLDPDHYDRIKGWRIYEVTCDDPGLAKPAFLAAKNAEMPVQAEVDALDRTIDRFVWGGLQMTTKERYPYAIYGIPDWKTLRESKNPDRTKGVDHVWRPYDYPHLVLMYRSMARIARDNPGVRTRLSAREYLTRAYGTAHAMFTVPRRVIRWSAYETGFYNEVAIPGLIDDLRASGMAKEAATLAACWAQKVRTFVGGKVDLFGSEYAFDSTGFESTAALADAALRHGPSLGIDAASARRFLDRQMAANLFCRGAVEPAYYLLGSDYRGAAGDGYTLSYMAPMGGWGVLDYGLHYAQEPASYLRLGYQSILSSWALVNAGTAASGYGAWYPGAANDGGAGGGFEPAAYGKTWLDQPHGRGSWYYSCESDLGYCGYLRAARTIVADDPIFGRFCFGGAGAEDKAGYRFVPRDGVRRRISVRTAHAKVDVELDGARFDARTAAVLDEARRELRVRLEPTATPGASLIVSGSGRVIRDGQPLMGEKGRYRLGPSARNRWVTIAYASQ